MNVNDLSIVGSIKDNINDIATTLKQVTATTIQENPALPIESDATQFVQDLFLIWLDVQFNNNNKAYQDIMAQLESTILKVEQFTDVHRCVECVRNTKNQKILLIIAEAFHEHTIPLIHDLVQLENIFVFSKKNCRSTTLSGKWPKIVCISSSLKEICKSVQHTVDHYNYAAVPISIIPQKIAASTTMASEKQEVYQLSPSFLYAELFKKIALENNADDVKSMKNFIIYCRGKGISESVLDNFKNDYFKRRSIWWSTHHPFIISMLNRAIRELDIETMIKMDFLVRNLHRQLEQSCSQKLSVRKKQFTVYYGQGFSPADFQNILNAKDGLISFNNFLVTNTKQKKAMKYVDDALRKHQDTIGVIFIIKIDPSKISIAKTPFALLNKYSSTFIQSDMLFSLHTIHRIDDITQSKQNDRLWYVHLTLTNGNNPHLTGLIEPMQEEIDRSWWYPMGILMRKLGAIEQAHVFYNLLLKNVDNEHELAIIYNMLGNMEIDQKQYDQALSFYEKSLAIRQQVLSQDDLWLAVSYNNIALAYLQLGNYFEALGFYTNALDILEKNLLPIRPDFSVLYGNMAQVYFIMGDYEQAIHFNRKAAQILEICPVPNRSDLADTYNSIGLAYFEMGDYEQALHFCQKAKSVLDKVTPNNPLHVAAVEKNIGHVHNELGDYVRALECYTKVRNTLEKVTSSNPLHIAYIYHDIGLVCFNMGNYLEAFDAYDECRKIIEQLFSSNDHILITLYNNLAEVCKKLNDYTRALEFYEKLHYILIQLLPAHHIDLAILYENLGEVCYNIHDYYRALLFYEKSLKVLKNTQVPPYKNVINVYNSIAQICKDMRNYETALEFYERSYEIMNKILPVNHPDFTILFNNIGDVYMKMQNYIKALEFYEKVPNNTEYSECPDLLHSTDNISHIYAEVDEDVQSKSIDEKISIPVETNVIPIDFQRRTVPFIFSQG